MSALEVEVAITRKYVEVMNKFHIDYGSEAPERRTKNVVIRLRKLSSAIYQSENDRSFATSATN